VFSLNGQNLPGTNSTYAAVPTGFRGQPTRGEFSATAGTLNACSFGAYTSFIPETKRYGLLVSAKYGFTKGTELFSELLFSHVLQTPKASPPGLFALPGFAEFTVSATNPFNPFGVSVGTGYLFTQVGSTVSDLDTNFIRPLVGVRGTLAERWHWEAAAWTSSDRLEYTQTNQPDNAAIQAALDATNPGAALNPFVDGPAGAQATVQPLFFDRRQKLIGQTTSANAFLRGPLAEVPSGAINVVLGAEFDRNTLQTDVFSNPTQPSASYTHYQRENYAAFGETRLPLVGNRDRQDSADILAVNIAARYDHYEGFGGKTTPQFGGEWRPFERFLVRGSYGDSFKAPSLLQVNSPASSFQSPIVDPQTGQTALATVTVGGNPALKPETGLSRTFGFLYTSKALTGLQLSVTHWDMGLNNNVQIISAQTIVNNESLFPGNVTRLNGSSGPITAVNATYLNFGAIHVSGFDFQVAYSVSTPFGNLSPSLAATNTYHYTSALTPNAPATDRVSRAQDDGNFAPRWKGVAALSWKHGSLAFSFNGRFVGRYQDYDSTRMIGDFWLYDSNVRYVFGDTIAHTSRWLRGAYAEAGGVNLFNTLPQFSNYQGGFVGYDPTAADIRGRFLYAQIGMRL